MVKMPEQEVEFLIIAIFHILLFHWCLCMCVSVSVRLCALLPSAWACDGVPLLTVHFAAHVNTAGGLVGVCLTALMAKRGFGLVPVTKAGAQTSKELLIPPEDVGALAKLDSFSPSRECSNSIQVAALAIARELPHIERQISFESTPGDFFHENSGRRVKNHFNFPITNDPSTFKTRTVTRGTQTDSSSGREVSGCFLVCSHKDILGHHSRALVACIFLQLVGTCC